MITRRLTAAFIIALVISGGFTYWLSQRFTKNHPVATAVVAKSQYVAAAANIEPGQAIKAENLRMVDWPASVPLPGAFTAPQALIGRTVLYPVSAGEPILDRQLANAGSGVGLTVKIPDGMRAISLRTDEVVGVAGYILPGTHVDVLVTLHLANIPDPVTATILQDVQVLAIGQKIEPDPEGKPAPATVVTLLLNPSDAEKIDLASSQGAIHFVLRNGSDSGQPTQTPAMMTQLGGLAIPPAEKPHKAMMAAAKPYQVETFMGPNVKTDNFQ